MALTKPCRNGNHHYDGWFGAGAGLGRRRCADCGSIQIDLNEGEFAIGEDGTKVFAHRRPSLFSVPDDPHARATVPRSIFGKRTRRR